MNHALKQELKATFFFEAFNDEQLEWVIANSAVEIFQTGERPIVEGGRMTALWILLSGTIRFVRRIGGQEILLDTTSQPGRWAGWLPIFDLLPASLTIVPVEETRLLRLPPAIVDQMLHGGFPVAYHLINGIYGGVRAFEQVNSQQDKLAALGKLSAGLAHELNNPAAAASRAASQLRERLSQQETATLALGAKLTDEQRHSLQSCVRETVAAAAQLDTLDPIARSDREDALLTWLEAHDIERAWELAPALVEGGMVEADLEELRDKIPSEALGDGLNWLAGSLSFAQLVNEIERSSSRIAELVGAIKEYSYMDRAQSQEIDVHDGLDSTLTILANKLRTANITVRRDYDQGLPKIQAYGGALNQVWTNLIANAIDALDEVPSQRMLTVRTWRRDDFVQVEIIDNGPGIPDDIRKRVFEPFFTTKEVGQGTGLGLDISQRIIVNQHRGEIKVESEPGATRFCVCLPVLQPVSEP